MVIKPLQNLKFDLLVEAFKQAFADYEMQWNRDQIKMMLNRRGFVPELSFGAFKGRDLVAFTLNGIGNFNGIRTVYDTGTGTVKQYRGQGLATKIFEYSIPFLKEERVAQYVLEVLQNNTKAVAIYSNVGFKINRELNYFIQNVQTINFNNSKCETPYKIQKIELDNIKSLTDFWDFYPSWQNSFEAILRSLGDFIIIGIRLMDKVVGYCVFEPVSGDVTQIAVDKRHRRKGIGSLLLKEVMKYNKSESIKIINTESNCFSMSEFLKSKNILLKGKQYEMIKNI